MSASRVHRGCIMNLFSERYSIDLVPIPMRGSKVIIRMDWLGRNGAMIECERQLVRVRTPSGGELVIPDEGNSHGPTFCSPTRAKRYLQQGCFGFRTFVVDTRVQGTTELSGVPIVQDFPDIFPKDFLGVRPERQVKFRIDLVPGATPIA